MSTKPTPLSISELEADLQRRESALKAERAAKKEGTAQTSVAERQQMQRELDALKENIAGRKAQEEARAAKAAPVADEGKPRGFGKPASNTGTVNKAVVPQGE